jgi:long-subunit acyl-CoA synthetase (AMP-forming)
MATETAAIEVPALRAATMCEAFQITAAEHADGVAVRTPGGGMEITYGELAERVRRAAAGLAKLGVGRGDTVAIMLLNRPEFHLVDLAAMHLGAIPFSIYNTSAPEQIEYLFSNAENRVVITEEQFVDTIRAANAPGVKHLVCVDGEVDGTTTLDELEASGDDDFDFESAWRAVQPEDVLTLIYTSGTTGPPKGVQITHANMIAELHACHAVLGGTPGGRATSYLPLAHLADRWASHYSALMTYGATVTSVPDPRQVVAVLPEVRPTAWGAVPRIWEKIKAALEAGGVADPSQLPEESKAAIRAKLGLDQVESLVSGAAPIPVEVLEYFKALGLEICELWGMSETSCCATINPPGRNKIGTVGPPLPGVELKLAEDGELLCRGPLIMKGYRNDPEKTAEAIDPDGWLHTGDVAEIDEDGYVKIVDRKKELIINAAGKNMSPANIEQRLKSSSPLIGQAVCIGDRRPYNVALIVLDPDAAAAARSRGDDIETLVAAGVEEANSHLSRVEQIKRHTILPVDWEPGGDELTPTMKLKRKPIAAKYADEIEALYAGA